MSKRSLLLFLCHQAIDIWVYMTSEDAEAAFQSFINNSSYKFILDHPHFRNELFTNILTSIKKKITCYRGMLSTGNLGAAGKYSV
jgi:hypothetical protein